MKTVKYSELRTIFVHPKTKKLYIEFWDESGKIRQKSTGMDDTLSNRRDIKNKIVYKDFCKENQINPDYPNYILDGSGSIVGVNLKKSVNWWPKYCLIYTGILVIILAIIIFIILKFMRK